MSDEEASVLEGAKLRLVRALQLLWSVADALGSIGVTAPGLK
jgi:hypothetical protein